MSLIAEVGDLLPHTITIETWSSEDSYGQPTYSTCSKVPARVEMKARLIAGSGGREISARGRIFLKTGTIPSTKDRITLPSGYTPTQPGILDVQPVYDETQLDHVVVWF